jgi:predicted DNA-binding ArsR family transcriptional regulator
MLVEHSIQRLLPIISRERSKHETRKEFLVKIKKHFKEGETILNDIKKQLGDDDPIIKKFAMIISSYEIVRDNMEAFIDRSRDIENFDAKNLNP